MSKWKMMPQREKIEKGESTLAYARVLGLELFFKNIWKIIVKTRLEKMQNIQQNDLKDLGTISQWLNLKDKY